MKNAYKVVVIGAACVIFLVGLLQKVEVPLTVGGGGVGQPRIANAHAREMEVQARQADVTQTVLQLMREKEVACAQQQENVLAAVERMEAQHLQKDREDAQRKDAGEVRKTYIQLGLSAVLLVIAGYLFLRKPGMETAALTLVTAALSLWGK